MFAWICSQLETNSLQVNSMVHYIQRLHSGTLMRNNFCYKELAKVQVGQIGPPSKQILNHKLLNNRSKGPDWSFFISCRKKKSNVPSHSKCDHKNELKAPVVYRWLPTIPRDDLCVLLHLNILMASTYSFSFQNTHFYWLSTDGCLKSHWLL